MRIPLVTRKEYDLYDDGNFKTVNAVHHVTKRGAYRRTDVALCWIPAHATEVNKVSDAGLSRFCFSGSQSSASRSIVGVEAVFNLWRLKRENISETNKLFRETLLNVN